MFCSPRGAKKGINLWTNTSAQRCLYPLFQSQSPAFCCPLFSENYLNPQENQQNSKQIYCQLPIIIFLWTPNGFISTESFFNFLLNLPVYSAMVLEKFQVYSVKTTAIIFVSQKIESFQFYSCCQAKLSSRFLSLSPRQTGIAHSSRTAFSKDTSS